MRIAWALAALAAVCCAQEHRRGIRNFYTGKVLLGFEDMDDDAPEFLDYTGGIDFDAAGAEQVVPSTTPSEPVTYIYEIPVTKHAVWPEPEFKALPSLPEKPRRRKRPIRTTTTTTTMTTEMPVKTTATEAFEESYDAVSSSEFATGNTAPPAPMEIPPELRGVFGTFGIGGPVGGPVFETQTETKPSPPPRKPKTTKKPATTTTVTTTVPTDTAPPLPDEIPPHLRAAFGMPLESPKPVNDRIPRFPKKKHAVLRSAFGSPSGFFKHSPKASKSMEESNLADEIEEQFTTKVHKRRRKHRKMTTALTSTTTTTTTTTTRTTTTKAVPIEDDGDYEEWEEIDEEEEAEEEEDENELRKKAEAEIAAQRQKEDKETARLRHLEEERLRALKEKEAELLELREAIRKKQLELLEHEKLEKSLLSQVDEEDEEMPAKSAESADAKKKAEDLWIKTRLARLHRHNHNYPINTRPVAAGTVALPPIPDSMRLPNTHTTPQKPKMPFNKSPFDPTDGIIDIVSKTSSNFSAKITPHKPRKPVARVTSSEERRGRVHGIKSFNIDEVEKKETGYAELKVHPAPEEEIVQVESKEAMFKGSWDSQPAIVVPPTTSTMPPETTTVVQKWSKEMARIFYEQYYKEWLANQTEPHAAAEAPKPRTPGLQKRPKLMPIGEVAAPPTPIPKTLEAAVSAKPVPLMMALISPESGTTRDPQSVPTQEPPLNVAAEANVQDRMPPGMGSPFQNPFMMAGGGLGSLPAAPTGNMFGILDPRMGTRGDLTPAQLNTLCDSVYSVSKAFGIQDVKNFAKMNCGFITTYYHDATCEQVQHVMEYCEAYFSDPEHKG